jgi:dienelactone hydrolase
MMKKNIYNLFIIGIVSLFSTASVVVKAEILPLDAFVMLPTIKQAATSIDGKKLAFLRASNKKGNYVIEVRSIDDLKKKPILLGAKRMEITGFTWLNSKKMAVTFRQNIQDGNKNYWASKLAIVNADGTGKWLVPFNKDQHANLSIISYLPDNDDEILIQYDINNNGTPDVISYNINTGRSKTVLRGNTKLSQGFIADAEGEIRAALGYNLADNSLDFYARIKGSSDWKLVKQIFAEERETYDFIAFSAENSNEIYINANLGKDKTGIYSYNLKSKKYSERLFGLEKVDTDGALFSNKAKNRGQLLGFRYTSKHPERFYTDEKEQALYKGIKDLFPSKYVRLASRSEDDNVIVVHTSAAKDPGTYYLLLNKNKLEKIGSKFPLLKPEHLSKVKYITYKARDGRKIPAYVTIPNAKGPHPAIVMPHGGPWTRDVVIYDEWSQLLAHHGYLVIQPQYRGSKGFGLDHWQAGDQKWGLAMQDDLDDAAQFLVKKGLADPKRLIMFGWSYGGYAAFVASMRDKNIYQCSIAGAGVSELKRIVATLLEDPFMRASAGPHYKGLSPIDTVEKVNIPILVIHGDIDGRVPVKHSRLFVKELKNLNKDHKYIELKGADHFSNRLYYHHKVEFYRGVSQPLTKSDYFNKTTFSGNDISPV